MISIVDIIKKALLTIVIVGISNVSFAQSINPATTPEGKLLTLRNQMESAQTVAEKKTLLKEMGQTGLFLAMATAAQYLDDKQLGTTAAEVVASVAMAHKDYNGINTRQWLRSALNKVNGKQRKAILKHLDTVKNDECGFVCAFNGKDLSGWKGLVEDPYKRAKMTNEQLVEAQARADEIMRQDWKVVDGCLSYVGTGYDNICTSRVYGDFEMYIDWKLDPQGKEPDAGIYLRGTPQVQIWDIARVNVGAQVGSGGLYNNQKNVSIPSQVADNKLGEWNSFYIKMVADKVTVVLNGVKVVDNVTLENYWDRSQPIFPIEQIELQAHGSRTYFRDIYIKDL